LEFTSYIACGPGCVVGPNLEYSVYKNWIELKADYKQLPGGWATLMPSLTRLFQGLLCLGVHQIGVQYFPIDFAFTDEFASYKTFLYRQFYVTMACRVHLYKFYGVWCFLDASLIACGLSFAGKSEDGSYLWDKLPCVKIWDVESACGPIPAMKGWNHQTHVWLNRYVQDRFTNPGERPDLMVTVKTMLVSAFWHGYYPCYYVMFFYCGVYVVLSKEIFKSRALFEFIPPLVQTVLLKIGHECLLHFIGSQMFALTADKGVNVSAALYHYVWILMPLALIIMKVGNCAKRAKKLEQSRQKKTE
jgi:lysophospholipid acyltransferase